jgi:hypothetical protein
MSDVDLHDCLSGETGMALTPIGTALLNLSKVVGLPTCGGCTKRAETLNRIQATVTGK